MVRRYLPGRFLLCMGFLLAYFCAVLLTCVRLFRRAEHVTEVTPMTDAGRQSLRTRPQTSPQPPRSAFPFNVCLYVHPLCFGVKSYSRLVQDNTVQIPTPEVPTLRRTGLCPSSSPIQLRHVTAWLQRSCQVIQWTGLTGSLRHSRHFRGATKAICAMAAMTAHASGTQAHPHAKLFPHAHGTGPRQCLRGTSKNISDTTVVI